MARAFCTGLESNPSFKSPTPERGLLTDTLCFATRHSVPAEPEPLRQHRVCLGAARPLTVALSLPLAVSAGIFLFLFLFLLQKKALIIKRKWAEKLDENKHQLCQGTWARPALGTEFVDPAQFLSCKKSVCLPRMLCEPCSWILMALGTAQSTGGDAKGPGRTTVFQRQQDPPCIGS